MPKKFSERPRNFWIGVFIAMAVSAVSFSIFYDVFAAPPVSPYSPGATLDPSCSPGDANCTVYSPLATTIATTTNIIMGTTSLSFATNTLYIDAANSRVGVGTTSPAYTFAVAGDINITGDFRVNGSVLSSGMGGSGTANYIPVFTAGTTIGNSTIYQSSGNVGIATTSPSSLFSVAGASLFGGNITATGTLTVSSTSTLAGATFSGNVGIGTTTPNAILNVVGTSTTALLNIATTASALYVTNLGNVGIGTTTPYTGTSTKLEVVGAIALGDSNGGIIYLNNDIQNNHNLYVQTTDVVNGGYTFVNAIPSYNNALAQTGFLAYNNTGVTTTASYVAIRITQTYAYLYSSRSSAAGTYLPLLFNVGGRNVAAFDTAGNFGVNTTTPGTMLNVVGTSTTALLNIAASSTASALYITSIGNVGIATTSPSSLFSVAGASLFGGNITATGTLTISSTSTLAGATFSGNVGIGTTTPSANLAVSGSFIVSSTSTLGTVISGIWNGTAIGDTYISSASTWSAKQNAITLATSTTGTDFSVTNSDPTWTLNMPSASASVRGLLTSTDWSTFNNKEGAISAGTTAQYWRGDKSWQTLNQAAVAGLTTASTPTFASTTLSNFTAGSIPFFGTDGVLLQNNSYLYWNNANGRLGLGTTSPSSLFSVAGASLFGGNITATGTLIVSSTSTLAGATFSGNVGIGTTSTVELLTLGHASAPIVKMYLGVTQIMAMGEASDVITGGGDLNFGIAAGSGRSLVFGEGVTELARLNANGLGIGTTTPSEQLQITANFRLPTTASSSGSTAGIIKMGTNNFIHAFGTNNTFLGASAGNLTLTGDSNTGIGLQSLNGLMSGTDNTAVGVNALYAATSGVYNVALGSGAGQAITRGSYNIAIGGEALFSATSTGNNTTIGYQAGYLTEGTGNVFIGYNAGYNETGSNKLYIANSSTNPPLIYGDFSQKYIGLGTTTPSGILHIATGTINAMLINDTGQIAFGTTSPPSDSDMDLSKMETGGVVFSVRNNLAGTGNFAQLKARGDDAALYLTALTSLYTSDGVHLPSGGVVRHEGSGGLSISADNALGGLRFYTAGVAAANERMRIDSNGYVGIATTTPSSLFVVATGTTNALMVSTSSRVGIGTKLPQVPLQVSSSNSAASMTLGSVTGISFSVARLDEGYGMHFGINANNGTTWIQSGRFIGAGTVYDLTLQASGGNVGIGTTTPSFPLSVTGNSLFAGNITATGTLTISSTTTFNGISYKWPSADGTSAYVLSTSGTGQLSWVAQTGGGGSSPESGWRTSGDYVYIATTSNIVGIGTTTPATMLNIFGTSTTALLNVAASSSVSALYITNRGNIGIGTTTPVSTAWLQVATGSLTVLTGGSVGIGTTTPLGLLTIGTTSSNVFVSASNGYVGIGTTTPTALLQVHGTPTSPPLLNLTVTNGATTTYILYASSSGYIGIGTSTPTTTLDVIGGLSVSATSTLYGETTIYDLVAGNSYFDTDSGMVTWIDMAVTANSATGSIQSYTAQINGIPMLTVYSLANGSAGGVYNQGLIIGTTTPNATSTFIDLFQVATGTMTSLAVTYAGNVGIGTSTPASLLQVATGTLTVLSAGYVGISTTTPIGLLQVATGSLTVLADGKIGIGTTTPGTAAVSIMSGNVAINTTTPAYLLHVYRSDDGIVAAFTDSNGTCTVNPTTPGFDCSSDIRLKKDIVALDSSQMLQKLLNVQGINFKWINQKDSTSRFGFSAQEIEKIFPEFVNTDTQGYKLLSSTSFIPVIIEAIKALNQKINSAVYGSANIMSVGVSQIGQEIIRAKSLITDLVQTKNLEIGSNDSPAGFTIYDRITKEPYCVVLENGDFVKIKGKCTDTQTSQTETATTTKPITTPEITATTTETITTTTTTPETIETIATTTTETTP